MGQSLSLCGTTVNVNAEAAKKIKKEKETTSKSLVHS